MVLKQYRGEGKPHGLIERPNIKEIPLNMVPDGAFQIGNPSFRRRYSQEIPKLT